MTTARKKKELMLSEKSKIIRNCSVKLIQIDIQSYLPESTNKRNLRKHNQQNENFLAIKKTTSSALVRTKPKLNIKKIWEVAKNNSRTILKKNDYVCAKVKGYRPWPGQIISIVIDSVRVKFFGSTLDGLFSINECVHFSDCAPMLTELLLHPVKDFESAVRQCEQSFNIPIENSLITLASKLNEPKK